MNNFEFGFALEDITPAYGIPLCGYFNPRPNKGYFDRLRLKAAAFRTGSEAAAVVSYDLCFITSKLVDKVEKALAVQCPELCGKVIYSATHTHTGPYTDIIFGEDFTDKDYMESLCSKTVMALKNAFASLAPSEMYTAVTECSTMAFNRRYKMKNGKILTNPGKLNPDIICPEGGVDYAIMLMEIRQEGRPVMIMANLSNHTDTIGGDIVSADWPGVMESEIQRSLDMEVPVMTIVAPQGNINHFNVATPGDQTGYEEAKRIGKAYAAAIIGARYTLKQQKNCSIKSTSLDFAAPYLQLTDAEYAEAKKTYEENKDATMEAGRDFTSEDIARGVPFVKKFFAEMAVACRENPITEKRVVKQMAIMFGEDLAIVTLPCEPFVEIGFDIRNNSRFPMTMLAALAMDEIGYVGLPENYGNGGYETSPSRSLADRTVGETMIKGALQLLK